MPKKRDNGTSQQGPKKTRGPRIRSSHGAQRDVVRAGADMGARRAGPPKKGIARANDSPSVASDEARELATWIAVAAMEKKAVGLEILDVAGKVDYADFLVLMTGRSDRQVSALTQGIEEALKKKNKRPLSVEGMPHASWVLMDYGDVVVHVFQDQARGLYDLEGLWMDARRLPVPVPDGVR